MVDSVDQLFHLVQSKTKPLTWRSIFLFVWLEERHLFEETLGRCPLSHLVFDVLAGLHSTLSCVPPADVLLIALIPSLLSWLLLWSKLLRLLWIPWWWWRLIVKCHFLFLRFDTNCLLTVYDS